MNCLETNSTRMPNRLQKKT